MVDQVGGPSLSESEVAHIRLVEEYRHGLRRELEQREDKKPLFSSATFSEKLLFPTVVVLISAIVSGFAIPWILSKQDREKRMAALKAEIIESISKETATIAAAYQSYEGELENYWMGSLDLHVRYLQLGLKREKNVIGAEEFKREDDHLETDRAPFNEQLFKANTELDSAQRAFLVWESSLKSRLRLYYGQSEEREGQFAQLAAATLAASAVLEKKDAAYDAILKARGTRYAAFLQEVRAGKLPYEQARAKLDGLLGDPPQLAREEGHTGWNEFSATVDALQKEVLEGEIINFY
jgi:hypothetical protein